MRSRASVSESDSSGHEDKGALGCAVHLGLHVDDDDFGMQWKKEASSRQKKRMVTTTLFHAENEIYRGDRPEAMWTRKSPTLKAEWGSRGPRTKARMKIKENSQIQMQAGIKHVECMSLDLPSE